MWYRCHEFFRYLEPLNFEEYEKWKQLPDFPDILREHEAEVVELSGLVPGMIVELVKLSKDHRSFKRISAKFRRENLEAMKRKHMEYIRSPHYKELEFRQFLYSLFLKKSSPTTDLADVDYIDRGLLIAMNDKTLRFYNSVARDILIQSFLDVFRFR